MQISSARAFGGGERHLADLANALASRGHEVYAALAPHSPLRDKLTALPEQNLFTINLRNSLDVRGALELARVVREHRIEVLHAHVARDYPAASFAARRGKAARLVITRHVLFPLGRLHALTLARASRVIAVSNAVARSLRGQAIFPESKIRVVPNGIDLARFDCARDTEARASARRTLNLPPDKILVGTVGEINPLKGLEEFLRAASVVTSARADVDFVIAGDDPTRGGEHRKQVESLIRELNLSERVHLTGRLDDVTPLLCALDLFVSASRTESFGLAIVEAMAGGLAVVVTATEGAREVVTPQTGVLVPAGDWGALARAVAALIEDGERRELLGARARESARERFGLERLVSATERVYYEALSGG
ncbi:MAG TPA: glycosyltransferase family 4 protein [Pyrinomonadaceae bacterium]